jgi:hypothetical protein
MESERTQNFQDRLNQWIASQGFWFQLRYSMSGKGVRGSGLYHILRLTARVVVFLLVLAAGMMIYLTKRSGTEGFKNDLEAAIVRETVAREGKVEGLQRIQGKLSMTHFAARADEGAFFTDVYLTDVSCRMGIFDGLVSPWKPGTITATRMDINLRAGARDEHDAARLGDALFKSRPNVEVNSFDVDNATVSWGYSEYNRGLIRDSQMKVRKRGSDWWFQFKGGTFSQNWLKGLQIELIEVVCGSDGLVFEKGILKNGNGTLDLAGLKVTGKERPEVAGTIRLKNLSLQGMLPIAAESLVEAVVSGSLRVSGSTNSQDGIGFDGNLTLGQGDAVMVRDRLPLLKALKAVDVFNNYRRVSFQGGSFHLKTGKGRMEISEVDLVAGDLMTMRGGFLVRPPTKEERALAGDASTRPAATSADKQESPDEIEFTLKRAAAESRKKDKKDPGVMGRYEIRVEERRFAEQMTASIAEALRYEGEMEITLHPAAFDQSAALQEKYPKNTVLGRIPVKVPLEGGLGALTLRQAEEISSKGKQH